MTNGGKPEPSGQSDRVATIGGWVFIGAIVGTVIVLNLDIPQQQKLWILVAPALAILVTGGIIALIVFRKVAGVASVLNFAALVLTVVLFVLAPMVLLDRPHQVLLLKGGAILFLSFIPGWLYLQFISVKGKTLRDEYVLNLHRLQIDVPSHLPEPPRGSLFYERWARGSGGAAQAQETSPQTVRNVYLQRFAGLYGDAAATQSQKTDPGQPPETAARFQAENLLPVIFATLLLAVGWTVVLQPEIVMGGSPLPTNLTLSGKPALPVEALRFGFVGAYFFVLQMLVRRYFQDDLKTSAYINSLSRVIAMALLVTALHVVWVGTAEQEYLFAFIIGVFPQVGLQAIRAAVTIPLQRLVPSLEKHYPLSELDGLNIWYESRLLEEGIEDMQNLATANLVDVILRTRIPVERLVDWVDQAHLNLRVRSDDGEREETDGQTTKKTKILSSRERLRNLGIRTATDLMDVMEEPPSLDGGVSKEEGRVLREKLRLVLNTRPEDKEGPNVIDAIVTSLQGEPNLYHVRCWKAFPDELAALSLSSEQRAEGATRPTPEVPG